MPEEIVSEEVVIRNREALNSDIKIEEFIARIEAAHQIKFEMLK